MASQGALLQQVLGELADFTDDLRNTLGDVLLRDALARDLGGQFTGAPPAAGNATPARDKPSLRRYLDADKPQLPELLTALIEARGAIDAVREIFDAFKCDEPGVAVDEIFALAVDLLATDYVRRHYPTLYFVMQFVGFASDTTSQFGEGEIFFDRFVSAVLGLLQFVVLGNSQPHWRLQSEADARALSFPTLRLASIGLVVARLKHLFDDRVNETMLDVLYGADTIPGLPRTPADEVADRMLTLRLHRRALDDKPTTLADAASLLSLAWVPAEHGGPGLFVGLGGEAEFAVPLSDRWQLRWQLAARPAFSFMFGGPNKVQFSGPAPESSGLAASVELEAGAAPGQRFAFSFPDGGDIRLEIGSVVLGARLTNAGPEWRTSLRNCVIALAGEQFDGFIGSLLGGKTREIRFSFGTGYSPASGFFTTGDVPLVSDQGEPPGDGAGGSSAGGGADSARPSDASPAPPPSPPLPVLAAGVDDTDLDFRIPVGKSLGPVRIFNVQLGIGRGAPATAGATPGTDLSVGVSIGAEIGPLAVRVDRIGMKFGISFPADHAKRNLHFAQVDVGFLPPHAVGVAIDAKAVKGGGFVFYDPDQHQYAGVLELEISNFIAVKAVGLVSTRLPDGAKGYSLLVIITAEGFQPIRLPMGFALAGIGGLLAIHRTVSEEALRDGLRNKSLDAILFPRDPVRNAMSIIATLGAVFPAQRGSYLLGPMLRITWGVPVLVTLDLAIIIEWGQRLRLMVLGRISAILPDADNDVIRLRMDVLGVFDFDQGTAAIDAVLVDSKLLRRFALTGAMAMRLRWKSPRSFALAVGGLHRAFTPPANFPTLERLALSLTTGSNPRLTCEAYFAITSNTLQFGAAAHLYAEAAGFNVTGDVGFDVLITLSPFHFLAEFLASMQVARGSHNLLKVKVEGALEGPRPLALRAKATFEILWWDVSIRVNATLVEGERPAPPPAVNALEQLLAALRDARNWVSELPAGQSRIVVLRDLAADAVPSGALLVHPLATLAVRQGVAPLDTAGPIDKFGDAPVAGAKQFSVGAVSINGKAESPASVKRLNEDFAPAQFFDMPDERKLASPSFEPMVAGVQFGDAAPSFNLAQGVRSPFQYETKLIDRRAAVGSKGRVTTRAPYPLDVTRLEAQARHGAAGRSVLRREDPLQADAPPAPPVRVRAPEFAVLAAAVGAATTVGAATLKDAAGAAPRTGVAAGAAAGAAAAGAPARADRRATVVPGFELAE